MIKTDREKQKKWLAWIAAAAWAGVIFYFSAQPDTVSSEQSGVFAHLLEALLTQEDGKAALLFGKPIYDALDFLVRKTAHFFVYFVLGALSHRAVRLSGVERSGLRWTLCALSCALYAATDEIHQFFIPGRAMMLTDVLLDSAGAACGAGVALYANKRRRRKRRDQ